MGVRSPAWIGEEDECDDQWVVMAEGQYGVETGPQNESKEFELGQVSSQQIGRAHV